MPRTHRPRPIAQGRSTSREHEQKAAECLRLAEIVRDTTNKALMLHMAQSWIKLAEQIKGDQSEIAKAFQMASQEIDRLGDPLATDDERQLRKLRLIKGPQEFRGFRINRASV
jgi:hypothetical protein